MEITGKIISLLPLQSGQGKNGPWRKQDFIIETEAKFPKKICVSLWGDKIDEASLNTGDVISASVEIESREFNGKWYTDVKAWKITKASTNNNMSQEPIPTDYTYEMPEESEDLPF